MSRLGPTGWAILSHVERFPRRRMHPISSGWGRHLSSDMAAFVDRPVPNDLDGSKLGPANQGVRNRPMGVQQSAKPFGRFICSQVTKQM